MARAANSGSGGRRTARSVGPSAEELSAMLDPTREYYGISEKETRAVSRLLGDVRGKRINPFQSLPVAVGTDFYDALAIFEDDDEYEDLEDDVTAGTYYDPYYYPNYADEDRDGYDAPAPISVLPTSTTNYQRPRTVAAGYDKDRQTLTVVFRDGLFYNYYEVSPSEWTRFKSVTSKGRFIIQYLDSKPRGYADMGKMPYYARETLYRIVRTNQIFFKGHQGLIPDEKYTGKRKPATKANKPKTTALKSSKGNKKKR
jgi:hypothetical protein